MSPLPADAHASRIIVHVVTLVVAACVAAAILLAAAPTPSAHAAPNECKYEEGGQSWFGECEEEEQPEPEPIVCQPGQQLNTAGTGCVPIPLQCPSGQVVSNGSCVAVNPPTPEPDPTPPTTPTPDPTPTPAPAPTVEPTPVAVVPAVVTVVDPGAEDAPPVDPGVNLDPDTPGTALGPALNEPDENLAEVVLPGETASVDGGGGAPANTWNPGTVGTYDGGGALPTTGRPLGLTGLAGMLMMLTGLTLVVATRRRTATATTTTTATGDDAVS